MNQELRIKRRKKEEIYANIDPHEVARQVALALLVEPLAEKEGCTTRGRDISDTLRLIDLQTASVNVSRYFYELAERVKEERGQPRVFYDLLLAALNTSTKNSVNQKIINLGLLELLFPIVVARLTTRGSNVAVFKRLKELFWKSSRADVRFKERALKFAWSSSRKLAKQNYPAELGGGNLYEHYKLNAKVGAQMNFNTHRMWCEQIMLALPVAKKMHRVAKASLKKGLLPALETAYKNGLRQIPKPGIIADYTAVVAYLLISASESRRII